MKANLYIDGNFVFHVYKYVMFGCRKHINWKKFIDYIKIYISDKENGTEVLVDSKCCFGTTHYIDKNRHDFYTDIGQAGIMKMENALVGMKEDGVDVRLAVEAVTDYFEKEYDYFVIFAGDGDYVPLVDKMNSKNVKTLLFYMDIPEEKTRTSHALLESVKYKVNFRSLLEARAEPDIESIFEDVEPGKITDLYGGMRFEGIPRFTDMPPFDIPQFDMPPHYQERRPFTQRRILKGRLRLSLKDPVNEMTVSFADPQHPGLKFLPVFRSDNPFLFSKCSAGDEISYDVANNPREPGRLMAIIKDIMK